MARRTKDEEKQFRQKIEGWDGTNSERHTQGTKESGVELRMAIATPWRAVIYMIVVKIATVGPSVFLLLHIIHYLWQIKDPPWADKGRRIKQNNSCWVVSIHHHTLSLIRFHFRDGRDWRAVELTQGKLTWHLDFHSPFSLNVYNHFSMSKANSIASAQLTHLQQPQSASRTLMDVDHKINLKTKYEQTNKQFLNKYRYYGNVCLNIRSRCYVRSMISSYLHSNFSIFTEHWLIQTCVCCYLVGEHLRLCPQDYTCCSSQMEETLSLQSERDFLKAVEDSSQFLLTTFTQRHRRFDGENSQLARCLI